MGDDLKLVKELRDKTGAGFLDCKEALSNNNGSIDNAIDYLRKKGLAKASKKSSREANEGAVGFYENNSICILIVEFYHLSNSFNTFDNYYKEYGILIVLGAGFTPFPFKFITIASGVFSLNIFLFIMTAFVARGLRFYLLASLLFIFGEKIKILIDKYFNILAVLFFILLLGSFMLIKLF